MTERRFYLLSLLLPVAVPLGAAVIALPELQSHQDSPSALVKTAFLVFLTGLYSTGPYVLFVLGLLLWARFHPKPRYRMIAWCTPLVIAIPFAPIFAAAGGSGGGPGTFARGCISRCRVDAGRWICVRRNGRLGARHRGLCWLARRLNGGQSMLLHGGALYHSIDSNGGLGPGRHMTVSIAPANVRDHGALVNPAPHSGRTFPTLPSPR